jgi:O-antigen ligase
VSIGLANIIFSRIGWFQFSGVGEVDIGARHGSRNVDVYTILPAFGIAFVYLLAGKNRLVAVLTLLAIFAGTSLSLSRGGFIVMLVSIIPIITNSPLIRIKRTKLLLILSLILVAFATIGLLVNTVFPKVVGAFQARYLASDESVRLPLMAESFVLMLVHPLVGVGLSNYQYYTKYTFGNQPIGGAHNAYLNFGAEVGFLGFIALILVYVYPIYRFAKLERSYDIQKYDVKLQTIMMIGKMLSVYLFLINFFNSFYLDAGHIFWYFYSLNLMCLYTVESELRNGASVSMRLEV